MPGLDTTTTNNDLGSSSGANSGDIGSGGTTVNPNGGTVVNPGSAAGNNNYQYEIVGLLNGVGSAYLASNSSNIACNSSVAVMNRNSAFAAMNTSTANLSNCATYVSQFGFMAVGTSRMTTQMSVSSLSTFNFYSKYSSSLYANTSMSVFPLAFGFGAYGNSSIGTVEVESMTSYWSTDGPIPTHFVSRDNSFVENKTDAMSARITPVQNTTSQGLSGPIVEGRSLKFMWSQIWRFPNGTGIINPATVTSVFSTNAAASYRFVPFSQSLDYGNIVIHTGGSIGNPFTSAGEDTVRGLLTLLATGRNNYTYVKPPTFMFQPEDKSGVRYQGGLTGSYSMSSLFGFL